VVNLVDTPGHVDFSGKVTRSMRAIDGAIVVVDAVEGVMAQTENVLREAIKERVKPVLFINKIDRLIRELKLPPKQIQERLTQIIERINNLIAEMTDSQIAASWQVSVDSGTVAFGSALHKWGFTVPQIRRLGLRFIDILKCYQTNNISKLVDQLPLHTPILDMILRQLPSPREAQRYRIRHIWRGDPNSPAGIALQRCDAEGPLVACITKVVEDTRFGYVAVGRVFSGTIRRGMRVCLLSNREQFTVQQVSLFMGPRRVTVPAVTAGNICGIVGNPDVRAGDTITGIHLPEGMVPFEDIKYLTAPVVTIAVEPKRPRELSRLLTYLDALTKKDPNLVCHINEETGEYLLSGMGLLHLEIAIKEIEKAGIAVQASEPTVLYQEMPKHTVTVGDIHSPNMKNSIKLAIHPRISEHPVKPGIKEEGRSTWYDDSRSNVLLYCGMDQDLPTAVQEAVISGFKWACERGPLCSEPVAFTEARILELHLSDLMQDRRRVELMSMMKDAMFEAFGEAGMTLVEPIYEIQVVVPREFLKGVTSVLLSRRGRVELVEPKGALVAVRGVIPVRETFDLATAMRSKTSGRALWQTRFYAWQRVPENLVEQIVFRIRKRKGLA